MRHLFARLADPWGITWRAANLIKRFNIRRSLRFLCGYFFLIPRYERPVFIIGVPRSGTTALFRLLRESAEMGSLPQEGHDLWRMYHHPRYTGWRSDGVGSGQVRFGERRFVNAYFYSYFDAARFVEKTPENALRISYLLDLFPDAIFLVIKRNPCDVISSLIDAWRDPSGRFRSYYVPEDLCIPGHPHRRQWRFALIEGWRDHKSSPIPEIAFIQWQQASRAIVESRKLVDPNRWLEIHLEDLISKPDEIAARVFEFIDIQPNERLFETLHELVRNPANALSEPGREKWKRRNRVEITTLIPRISPIARELNYVIDVRTGRCRIERDR